MTSAKALHVHACKEHVITVSYRGLCEWEGCDNIKRQRWSTVTHIQVSSMVCIKCIDNHMNMFYRGWQINLKALLDMSIAHVIDEAQSDEIGSPVGNNWSYT